MVAVLGEEEKLLERGKLFTKAMAVCCKQKYATGVYTLSLIHIFSGEDVQIWLEEQGENSFNISAYCEKLLPMLREEEGRAWWMLTTLTDQVLGEIPHMRYIAVSYTHLDRLAGEGYSGLDPAP